MPFSKTFPKTSDKSVYPKWEEIFLTEQEEKEQEVLCKTNNIELMKECIDDAKSIIETKTLKRFQTDLVNIALKLFDKRASHEIHWKENKAKEKFDKNK